ncbi:MAG: hypothetical protein ABFC84_04050 [Veillonellales bacterium]
MKKSLIIILTCFMVSLLITPAFAAPGDITSMNVAIKEMQVYNETTNQWVTIYSTGAPTTLDIVNTNLFSSTTINLPAGHYTYLLITQNPAMSWTAETTTGIVNKNVDKSSDGTPSFNNNTGYGMSGGHYMKAGYVNFTITPNTTRLNIKFGATVNSTTGALNQPVFQVQSY